MRARVALLVVPLAAGVAAGSLGAARSAGPGDDATVAAKEFSVVSHSEGDAVASCSAGERVLGGGIGQTGPTSPDFGRVQESGPVDETGATVHTDSGDVAKSWNASVSRNKYDPASREYRVFAICSASSDATVVAKVFTVPQEKVGDAVASCPSGRRVLGGGVGQSGPTSPAFGWIQQSGPLSDAGSTAGADSGDVARSWYASVYNYGSQRNYRVFAICSARSDATIQAKVFSVEPGTVRDDFVACPAGQRLVGGGVGQTGSTNSKFGVVQQSGPLGPSGATATTKTGEIGRYWYASVFYFSQGARRDYKVFAICARPDPTTTTTQATTTGTGATRTTTAATTTTATTTAATTTTIVTTTAGGGGKRTKPLAARIVRARAAHRRVKGRVLPARVLRVTIRVSLPSRAQVQLLQRGFERFHAIVGLHPGSNTVTRLIPATLTKGSYRLRVTLRAGKQQKVYTATVAVPA